MRGWGNQHPAILTVGFRFFWHQHECLREKMVKRPGRIIFCTKANRISNHRREFESYTFAVLHIQSVSHCFSNG